LLTLAGRTEVAERTIKIDLARPPGLAFKPGQYMDFTLVSPPESDDEGNVRSFSICSAPSDETLSFTTRLRDSAFKRVLATMPLGSEIQAEGPYGDFTLPRKHERPAVLLAGGIGVTPFRSMIRETLRHGSDRKLILFCSNRRPEDAPFLDEFREFSAQHPNFSFVPTMSQPQLSKIPWKGRTGRIELPLLHEHLRDLENPMYYIAGPPDMVAALTDLLTGGGIQEDDIRTEEFSGY
jgi:ferredoxin-NADP reductase